MSETLPVPTVHAPRNISKGAPFRAPYVNSNKDACLHVVEAIKLGNTFTSAARAGGVSPRSVYGWLQRGREIRDSRESNPDFAINEFDDDYVWFLEQVEDAEAHCQMLLMSRIHEAGEDKWQANAWILERRWPHEYSLRTTVQHKADKKEDEWTVNIGAATHSVVDADYQIVEDDDESIDDTGDREHVYDGDSD